MDKGKGGKDHGQTSQRVRDYAAEERPTVKEFYRLNHSHQTLDFVLGTKSEYLTLDRRTMDVWGALEDLNTLVDDSDPHLDLTQIDHARQTAESIRRASEQPIAIFHLSSVTSGRIRGGDESVTVTAPDKTGLLRRRMGDVY